MISGVNFNRHNKADKKNYKNTKKSSDEPVDMVTLSNSKEKNYISHNPAFITDKYYKGPILTGLLRTPDLNDYSTSDSLSANSYDLPEYSPSKAKLSQHLKDLLRAGAEVLFKGGGVKALWGEALVGLNAFKLALTGRKYKGENPSHINISSENFLALDDISPLNAPYSEITDETVENISSSGWQGQPLWCGAGVFEDNHLLAYEREKADGSKSLVLSGKILKDKDDSLLEQIIGKSPIFTRGLLSSSGTLLEKGELKLKPEEKEFSGNKYEIKIEDNIKIIYKPYEKNYSYSPKEGGNPVALQGDFEIVIDNYKGDKKEIKKALKKTGRTLDINTDSPTRGEMELLYIEKNIKAMNLDTRKYKDTKSILESQDISISDRINVLASYIKSKTGIKDIRKTEGYNWQPCQDRKDKKPSGKPYWKRIDREEHLSGSLAGYVLGHNIYGKDEASAILNIFKSGSLLTTKEREFRLGIGERGLSSERDLNVGAANYTFFHPHKNKNNGTLIFSGKLLERTDNIIHPVGIFGNESVKGISLENLHKTPAYEIMVEGNVPVENYVEQINVRTEKAKNRVIKGLMDMGIEELRGRPLSEAIQINSCYNIGEALKISPGKVYEKEKSPLSAKKASPSLIESLKFPSESYSVTGTEEKKALQTVDGKFMESITKAGKSGYTYLTSGEDIEDGSILIEKKEYGLDLHLKLTGRGNDKFLEELEKEGVKGEDKKEGRVYKFKTDGLEIVYQPKAYDYQWTPPHEIAIFTHRIPEKKKHLPKGITPYALQGSMKISLKNYEGRAEDLKGALKKLKNKFNIDTSPASAKDTELIYLEKLAYLYKVIDRETLETIKPLPQEKRREIFKKLLSEKLKIDDITEIKGYEPEPEMDFLYKDGKETKDRGGRVHYTFPVTDLHPELKNFRPFTYIHADPADRLPAYLEGGGNLLSRRERMRQNIENHGMGSLDLVSGGADYVYCHLEKDIDAGDLVFRPELLNRIDQIAHDSDQWGMVLPQAEDNRPTAEEYSKNYIYEVMFKHDINIMKYLTRVNVWEKEQKENLIKKFKEKNIHEIDGKPLEEAIQVKSKKQRLEEEAVHKLSFFNTVIDSKQFNKKVVHKIVNEIFD